MSAFWMVLSRWAMTNEVLERRSNFKLCWIACSLSLSRLLVASSRMRIFGSASIAYDAIELLVPLGQKIVDVIQQSLRNEFRNLYEYNQKAGRNTSLLQPDHRVDRRLRKSLAVET